MLKTLGLPDDLTQFDLASEGTVKIFTGRANPKLGEEIAKELGLELGKIKIQPFSDGEIYVQIQEYRARNRFHISHGLCLLDCAPQR